MSNILLGHPTGRCLRCQAKPRLPASVSQRCVAGVRASKAAGAVISGPALWPHVRQYRLDISRQPSRSATAIKDKVLYVYCTAIVTVVEFRFLSEHYVPLPESALPPHPFSTEPPHRYPTLFLLGDACAPIVFPCSHSYDGFGHETNMQPDRQAWEEGFIGPLLLTGCLSRGPTPLRAARAGHPLGLECLQKSDECLAILSGKT
jgi:hypothetical protein